MNKIIKLTLLLVLIFNCSYGQQRVTIKKIESRLITNEGVAFVGELKDKGNDHYMFPKWNNNGVLFVGNNVYGFGNINFNISTNSIDSRVSRDKFFMFKSTSVDSVSINGHMFKKVGNTLYEVLYEKKNDMFLKKYDIKYTAGHEGRMGGVQGASQTAVVYKYVVKSNDEFKRVELNKKSITALFENKKDVLESFVKKERLSFKKEKDIIRMFEYLSEYSSSII